MAQMNRSGKTFASGSAFLGGIVEMYSQKLYPNLLHNLCHSK